MDKNRLSREFYEHLTQKIIPFWTGLADDEFGGYYGYVDYDLGVDRHAVKGCILNSRIMWFFANAAMLFKSSAVKELGSAADNERLAELCLKHAGHAHDFMLRHCLDREYGGVLWSVNYDGTAADTIKHTYNQAFSIYALASYYDATGDVSAYEEAVALVDIIESRCTDEIGYLEAFNRDFTPAANDKLSENGVMAEKTMNTLLHVFEAYTELLRVTKKSAAALADDTEAVQNRADCTSPMTADAAGSQSTRISREVLRRTQARLEERLRFMMDIIADKIYNPALRRQEVFFDREYQTLIDLHSYGHDIETSWLADRGLEVLADEAYTRRLAPITMALAQRILERAYVNHSLLNECERGIDNTHRIWWVQAETVLGFVNAAQKLEAEGRTEEAASFFGAAEDVWDMIQTKLTDARDGSEWYWELDEHLEPIKDRPIVEPWKCPYHNGRMCIEMITRLA